MVRLFNHYVPGRRLAFFAAESAAIGLGCAVGAATLSLALGARLPPVRGAWLWIGLETACLLATLQVLLYALDLYDLRVAAEAGERGARLLRAGGLVALVAAGMAMRWRLHPGALLGGALGACSGAVALRTVLGTWAAVPRRVLVIGTGIKAMELAKAMQQQGDEAYQIVQMVEPKRSLGDEGRRGWAQALVRDTRADTVVIALDEARGSLKPEDWIDFRMAGTLVYEAGAFCERALRRLPLTHLRASYFCFADELVASPLRRAAKRAFDLIAAGALAVLAAPLAALFAVAVKLDSRGPLFYGQERVGQGGRTFRLWKFRSMRVDAEAQGAVWARVNDDRVTRVGRFMRLTRMDELPQLLNVLRGEMSFVGPRPERPVFVTQLKGQLPFYGLREAVKPGITGWAQIRYAYGASVEDARNKLELDLYYIKNGSLFLDLAILFHTVRHVMMARGAR